MSQFRPMSRPVELTVALVALVALVGGCHGGGRSAEASPPSAAAAALVPAALRRRGTLSIGLDASAAPGAAIPDEFLAPDGRRVVGMDADLATAIGAALGLKVSLLDVPLPEILT